MNLIEALRTGLPLRRPIAKHWGSSKDGWLGSDLVKSKIVNGMGVMPTLSFNVLSLDEIDLLADDWEVKEEEVTITRNDFWRAYSEVLKENAYKNRTAYFDNLLDGTDVAEMWKKLKKIEE